MAEHAVEANELLQLYLIEESLEAVLLLVRVQGLELGLQLRDYRGDHLLFEGAPLREHRLKLREDDALGLDGGRTLLEHLEKDGLESADHGEELLIGDFHSFVLELSRETSDVQVALGAFRKEAAHLGDQELGDRWRHLSKE